MSTSRGARVSAAFCLAVPLGLYLATAARTMQGGDTAEFASLGVFGGVAHPPGYPLYTMLARLMGLLPIEPLFFRISLASVLCGAAAIVVLQRVALRLSGSLWASVTAALGFAVTSGQWRLAGVPEVFTMNVLLSLGGVLCCLRLAEAERSAVLRESFLLGLVFGLGVSNHHTIVLCAPVVLWALARLGQRWGRGLLARAFGVVLAGGLLGLLPYAELPYAAHHAGREAFVWGNPGTLDGLLAHFFRRQYGTFSFLPGAQEKHPFAEIGRYLSTLPAELGLLLLLAAVAGIALSLRRRAGASVALLLSWGLAGPLLLSAMAFQDNPVGRSIGERFYLLPNALLAPLVAVGLATLAARLSVTLRWSLTALAIALPLAAAYPRANWRADTADERYLAAAIGDLAPNAIVAGGGDFLMFGVHWVSHALAQRPDVEYVDTNFLGLRWYYDRVKRRIPWYPVPFIPDRPAPPGKFARIMMQRAPVYSLGGQEQYLKDDVQLEPAGFATRAVPQGTPARALSQQLERLESQTLRFGEQRLSPVDGYSWEVRNEVARQWDALASRMAEAGQEEAAGKCAAMAEELRPGEMNQRRSLLSGLVGD